MAETSRTTTFIVGDVNASPPKPTGFAALRTSGSDLAAQCGCEHEWLAHMSHSSEVGGGGGGDGQGSLMASSTTTTTNDSASQFRRDKGKEQEQERPPPVASRRSPAINAPPAPSRSAAAAVGGVSTTTTAAAVDEGDGSPPPRDADAASIDDNDNDRIASSSSSLSTPSTSSRDGVDDDDDNLDLVPAPGTFRSRRDAGKSSNLPMTSPAISDGGGLRDEHVEDPWSSSGSSSGDGDGDGGGSNDGDGSNGSNSRGGFFRSRLRPVGGILQRRRGRVVGGGGGREEAGGIGGGRGRVRRELLPPHHHHHHTTKTKKPPPPKRHLARTRSLRSPGRHFTVVTTASLPWMTGTSVNPTLRSAYLARALPRSRVTLLLPWLPPSQQPRVYPTGVSFEKPSQQEQHVRAWIRDRTGFDPPGLEIAWYHARYCPVMKSIFPYGDLTRLVGGDGGDDDDDGDDSEKQKPSNRKNRNRHHHHHNRRSRDVAILEEPEHLTWFHSGPRWTSAFERAIGIAHTNYADYVSALRGRAAGAAVSAANRALVAVHTDAVIRLSDALPALPRARTAFVHGVARGFITAGRNAVPGRGAYYVGKALWAKGYAELVALLAPGEGWKEASAFARSRKAEREWGPADEGIGDLPPLEVFDDDDGRGGDGNDDGGGDDVGGSGKKSRRLFPPPSVDAFGSGEDADAVRAAALSSNIPLTLRPGRDHLDPSLRQYRVFVNPSTSDVVATTSAEALALGRWLVCPVHPCNEFFARFRACLRYGDERGFRAQLCRALSRPPPKLSAAERSSLTWAAATRRFLDAVEAPAERQRAQNARRRGILLSASTTSLAGGSSVGEEEDDDGDEESDDEERRFAHSGSLPLPTTALAQQEELSAAVAALAAAPPPPASSSSSGKIARLSNSLRASAAALAESLTHRTYGLAMRVEASRRLMGAGKFTRVAPASPPGEGDHALDASRPCHVRAHEAQGYRRSRYVGGMG